MRIACTEPSDAGYIPKALALAVATIVLSTVRVALVTLLVILEPFVTVILMAIATLGVLMCLLNEFIIKTPHFPLWLMLSLSLGSAMLLLPYYALIRLLSLRGR